MLETAQFKAELTNYDETRGGTASFISKPEDGTPIETVTIDSRTWQEMGYPHFVTVTIKTTK